MQTAGSDGRRRRLQALFFLLAAGALLVALWQALKPAGPVPAAAQADAPVAEARDIDWVLRGGQRVSGPAVVTATVGETLRLRVRGDHADELHVHGYEITRALPADHLVVIELALTHSGRFEIELHHAHQQLAVLEVQPR